MPTKVKKKLLSLCIGELAAAIIFAAVWIMYLSLFEWTKPYITSWSTLYVFGLLEFLLLQGSYYWFLKLKQVQQNDFSPLPYRQLRIFALFKKSNLFLIGVGIIMMVYQLMVFPSGIVWFVFVYIFAIMEYINYFHIRISYQSISKIKDVLLLRDLRISKLAKDLKSLK